MGNNNTARQTGAKGAPAVSATPTAEVEKRAADAGVVSPDRNTPEETPIPEPAPLSPLPEKDAAPAPASSDAEGVPADDSVIVIAAYPGTKDLLQALWQKAAPGHCTLVFVDDAPFAKQFPALIADASIPDEFVFVPANCAPVAPVDFADLAQLKVYVRKDGSRHYAERLPMLLNKVALVELCGTMHLGRRLGLARHIRHAAGIFAHQNHDQMGHPAVFFADRRHLGGHFGLKFR